MMTLFLVLAALVTAARLGGALAQRFGQPAVLGELVVGILLGPSVIGLVHPEDASLHLLSEFGVVILLFQIGLHTDLRQLIKVGGATGYRWSSLWKEPGTPTWSSTRVFSVDWSRHTAS